MFEQTRRTAQQITASKPSKPSAGPERPKPTEKPKPTDKQRGKDGSDESESEDSSDSDEIGKSFLRNTRNT